MPHLNTFVMVYGRITTSKLQKTEKVTLLTVLLTFSVTNMKFAH